MLQMRKTLTEKIRSQIRRPFVVKTHHPFCHYNDVIIDRYRWVGGSVGALFGSARGLDPTLVACRELLDFAQLLVLLGAGIPSEDSN